jgi:ABC-type nitrate/sulfonate/bicarbonate transport system substrate-binding protein
MMTLALVLASSGVGWAQGKPRVLLFSQQNVATSAFDMAQKLGYFAEEGIEVEFRYFASGTTAFQAFRAGQGDIVYSGDIPAIRNWAEAGQAYRVVAPVERSVKQYGIVARSTIQQPGDLRGKKIATRVGSTASHLVWAFLKKHGMTEKDVTILNMDGPAMVSALDRGDIDAFVLWSPYIERAQEVSGSKVRLLAYADAVVSGYYSIISAREEWVQQNGATLTKFLRAAVRGQEYVKRNKQEVVTYLNQKFGIDPKQVSGHYDVVEFLLKFDEAFYKDFAQFAAWMQETGSLKDPLAFGKFVATEPLQAVNPALVVPPPR